MSDAGKPKIGISCGDLNGIGMEVIMKTFSNPDILELCTPVLFASTKVVSYHRKALDMGHFHFQVVHDLAKLQEGKPNLFNCWKEEVKLEMGKVNPEVGKYALRSITAACDALDQGVIDALVTAPIHKHSIQAEEFKHTGHTDYLEDRYKSEALMMLMSEEMRMSLATVHIPLKEVPQAISEKLILRKLNLLHQSLEDDFHIRKGKIAVLSLNPHAGDSGVIGVEDDQIVAPAIQKAFDGGIMAFGPFPADSFFGSHRHKQFDAILAMYHDQGLAPFKSLSFGEGVNYSAGLPIIRTSPDHGTGFDIAGLGKANESSFRQAVFAAIQLANNRGVTSEIAANPLK